MSMDYYDPGIPDNKFSVEVCLVFVVAMALKFVVHALFDESPCDMVVFWGMLLGLSYLLHQKFPNGIF